MISTLEFGINAARRGHCRRARADPPSPWQAFSNRSDVQAAVFAVGRIKQFSIGPTQGWD